VASKSPRCRYKKKIFIACTNAARSISLVRARYARPAQNTFFIKVSPQLRVSVTILDKFLVIIAGKNSRERQKRRDTKKQREKNLSLERAFLKNTNTIYDIKYAAIFHVQNDVRVPRRHFSFHRHLTHVLRRPGRRREHFTFHFFSFNVYLCLLIMCFLCVCSSSLSFAYFLQERGRKIKSKDISRRAHERIIKRTTREDFFLWMD
jgi:hypothetical protein